MSHLAPHWRCFQSISSGAEASSFAECCLFSLATLEMDCDPESKSFALTEQEQPGAWRWATVNDHGVVLHDGCEPTQVEAKRTASAALYDFAPVLIAWPWATLGARGIKVTPRERESARRGEWIVMD